MAQAIEATRGTRISFSKEEVTAQHMDRRLLDRLISWTGTIMAFALVALGAAAIYGGSFALDNVRDRLEPQNISFPPAEAMSDFDKAEGLTAFAGQKVDTGTEAEAFSRYIGGHLAGINEGATYSETSAAARAEGLSADEVAELQGKADTLFKGETLRAILLNAYGWWTVGLITMWAGYGALALGILLAVFAALGFRHARKVKTT